eukprot:TRINITY_DN6182_c0_g1_i13.p1 TRINITY_DN6182_c0_g1~~TRINITY_DN6182_c0_g1_i13.p1  ORF type:complete len:392 (+),score=18.61 TRINITY_DN6182_c0_g1_i13:116-1291(+)
MLSKGLQSFVKQQKVWQVLTQSFLDYSKCVLWYSKDLHRKETLPLTQTFYNNYANSFGVGKEYDKNTRILVTGAAGQIGLEFVPFLRQKIGVENVVASDIRISGELAKDGPAVYCDVTDYDSLRQTIRDHGITHVVHLATILSAIGEKNPLLALKVNTVGIQNLLQLAIDYKFKLFAPSTIAVFGATTPKVMTSDITITQPSTMYGITKVHQELLGAYYAKRYGVDFRSLRYPGIISYNSMPGGGTTDYAVEIFYKAILNGRYESYISQDTGLPMMYMPDCLEATWQLMTAPKRSLTLSTYNIAAMTFTPMDLAREIQKTIPHFRMGYEVDYRDVIAQTWPTTINDQQARKDWGWCPRYDLKKMTFDMIEKLVEKMETQELPLNNVLSPTA